ncbi:MAG: glycosyltransferase family 39 protein [Planctomycetes bacterium]|nr:glycosyltransferase family 39 protein [Planctomycetota bacterium]
MNTVRHRLALGLILLVATVVRFAGISARELWIDESCTFYCVHHFWDWPADGPDRAEALAHAAYFALLRGWTRLLGETEWGLRSFSVAAGVAGVWLLGAVGTRLGGRGVGLVAAALAALHPLHVHYSQEARAYALWMGLITLGLWSLHAAARTGSRRAWLAYGITAAFAVLTHSCSLLWLPATVATVIIAANRGLFLRRWVATHAALAVVLAPVLWFVVLPLAGRGPQPWLAELWQAYPPPIAVARSLWALLPSGAYPDYVGFLPAAGLAVSERWGLPVAALLHWGAAVVTAAFAAAATLLRERSADSAGSSVQTARAVPHGRLTAWLLAQAGGFLAILWLYSALVRPAYVVARYDLAAWPAVTLAVALLVERMARCLGREPEMRHVWRILATAILAVFAAGTTLSIPWSTGPQDNRARAERIVARVGPADVVVSLGMFRWFMAYEWHRQGVAAEVVSFPPAHDRQLCWEDATAELADRELPNAIDATLDRMDTALVAGRKAWIVAGGEPAGPRWEVDRQFYEALHRRGFQVVPHDEWTGLAEVVKPGVQ